MKRLNEQLDVEEMKRQEKAETKEEEISSEVLTNKITLLHKGVD